MGSHTLIGLTHWQHPSFFAYFPTGGTFEGILADLYSTSTPNPGFNVSPIVETTYLSLIYSWSGPAVQLARS